MRVPMSRVVVAVGLVVLMSVSAPGGLLNVPRVDNQQTGGGAYAEAYAYGRVDETSDDDGPNQDPDETVASASAGADAEYDGGSATAASLVSAEITASRQQTSATPHASTCLGGEGMISSAGYNCGAESYTYAVADAKWKAPADANMYGDMYLLAIGETTGTHNEDPFEFHMLCGASWLEAFWDGDGFSVTGWLADDDGNGEEVDDYYPATINDHFYSHEIMDEDETFWTTVSAEMDVFASTAAGPPSTASFLWGSTSSSAALLYNR